MRPLLYPVLAVAFVSLGLSCQSDPPPPPPDPVCGNGLLEAEETCEGDPLPQGCNPVSCTPQTMWICTPDPPGGGGDESGGGITEPVEWMSTCEMIDTCGDGLIDPGEDCDDGDMEVMDGCSGCRVDPLYTCMGEPSDCYTCGDGFPNPTEECDDGLLLGYDNPGCENCMVVPGWECFDGRVADLCGPKCGDGMWFDTSIEGVTIGFAEECDDGNTVDGDGCDGNCNIEDGYVCESTAPETSMCYIPTASTGTDSSSGPGSSSGSGSGSDSGTSSGGGGSGTVGSTTMM